MRIYPATHYTMGGLWVDYNLMTTIPGLFAAGEANFSDHGANRLGASALMQGLADGYFVLPSTLAGYLAGFKGRRSPTTTPRRRRPWRRRGAPRQADARRSRRARPTPSTASSAKLIWDDCGMAATPRT
jgi:succinate dehydrogenase / fumarate reductase flavoprotein subunit